MGEVLKTMLAGAVNTAAGWPPVHLPRSHQRDMVSRKSRRPYRIFVSRPLLPPPDAGYPVIYLLDGNAAFATMTEAVTMQSARPEATGVAAAIVVGIGYATELPLDAERRTLDYTPPVDRTALPTLRPDGTPWPPTGGAGDFLDFIEDDLKPAIARDFPVDPQRQALFGHSFGGLFALYALFTRPGSFQAYVAGSPSIWFGERAILETEEMFAADAQRACSNLRLMIGVGGLEQSLTPREREDRESSPRAPWIERNRMVDNAREMATRLAALPGDRLHVEHVEFAGENHGSVVPALISRAVRFAAPAAR